MEKFSVIALDLTRKHLSHPYLPITCPLVMTNLPLAGFRLSKLAQDPIWRWLILSVINLARHQESCLVFLIQTDFPQNWVIPAFLKGQKCICLTRNGHLCIHLLL